MNFLKIAWRDISSIFKNRFIRVSVIAIIVVPLLYSLLYLAAFWDPYGDLTKMPVAVVNLDKGQIDDGKEVNYGKDVIEKLKENKKVGWKFVSKEQGIEGLNGKGYYAEFIIPEDFSEKVISAKDGKPKQAKIVFVSNDKKNFLASQINGKVEVALKDEVASSITKEYTKVTFDNLYDIKDGMNKASDGSKQLKDGLLTAKDGSSQLKDGLNLFNDKIVQANDKMNQYKYLLPLLNEKNLDSVNRIMGYANTLKDVNIDPSMIKMLNEFSSEGNIDDLKNTLDHIKNANLIETMNSPEVAAISNMMEKVDLQDVQNRLKKVDELSNVIDMNKIKPMLALLDKSDDMTSIMNKATELKQDVQKYKPVVATLSNKDNMVKMASIMSQAEDLSKSLKKYEPMMKEINDPTKLMAMSANVKDMKNKADNLNESLEKYKPMMGLLNDPDKIISMSDKMAKVMGTANELNNINLDKYKPMMGILNDPSSVINIMNKADELNKIDITKLAPMMGVLNNADKLNSLMTTAEGLGKIDISTSSEFLKAQKLASSEFVKNATILNTKQNVASLKMAIQSNSNLTKDQKDSLNKLVDGYYGLVNGTKDNMEKSSTTLDSLESNLQKLTVAQSQLKDPETVKAMASVKEAMKPENIKNINEMMAKLQDMKKTMSSKETIALVDSIKSVMTEQNINDIKDMVQKIESMKSMLNDPEVKTLMGTMQTVMTKDNIKDITSIMGQVTDLQKSLTSPETKAMMSTVEAIVTPQNIKDVSEMLSKVQSLDKELSTKEAAAVMQTVKTAMKPDNIKDISEMIGKFESLKNQVSDEEFISTVKKAMTKENIDYMKNLRNQLVAIKPELDKNLDKIKEINTVIATLDPKKVESIKSKIEVLKQDALKAKPLMDKLQGAMTPNNLEKIKQLPALTDNLLSMKNDLKDNAEIMEIAEKALNKGNIEKAKKLIEAIPAMTDGVNKLSKGSNDLYDGLVKLHDGSSELNDKLTQGAKDMDESLINTSEDMGEFISKPVAIKDKPINPVTRYGAGFAPYFMPLSLWVGAIMMFFVITDKVDDDLNAKGHSIVTGKFLSYGFIGVLQAVLVSIAVMALGLRPTNVVLYFAINIFMSYVFIAIIQSLVFLLGDAGRLLATVLLLLQLTSSAGTFPIELVPKFFRTVNPFLPFTYGIEALREVSFSTNINYALLTKDVTILAGMLVGFLIISILMKKRADNIQSMIKERMEKAA